MSKPIGRHRSDLKFCGCRMCNYGMHNGNGGWQVQKARKQYRKAVKLALKQGKEPPTKWAVGYTD